LNLLTVLANVAAVRIEHARLIEIEQQEKLWARDREQAAEIQRSLLPFDAPSVPGFAIAGYNVASRAVGGDYYDFLPLEDGRLVLLVADVAGKGMPAALLMSGLQARVHVLFETGGKLAELVATLNRSLTRRFPSNRFVTFCVAALTPDSGEIAYCNAGHNPPLLLRAGGTHEYLSPTGPIIGISAQFTYGEITCRMLPGDILALYSDGVTEACDPVHEEEFGEERLLRALISNSHSAPASIIDAIVGEIAAFTGNAPLSDDVTLVVLKRS
jgi:serine phosphatase RsbU (regulator of sigma subunit)